MNFKSLRAAFTGLILSIGFFVNVANAGLITNGSFESGITGWTVEDSGYYLNNGYVPGGLYAQDGSSLITLQVYNNGGRISQQVVTDIGQAYSLSFYHAFLDYSNFNSVAPSITWSIGELGSEIISPASFVYDDHRTGQHTDGWNLQTVNFVATSLLTRVAFQGTPDNTGGYWGIQLDNVSMATTSAPAQVPEPSTLAIFALGMIGLASRRFKKQS